MNSLEAQGRRCKGLAEAYESCVHFFAHDM